MDTYGYLSGHPFSGLHMLSEQSAYYQEQGYWDPERREYTYSKQMGEKEKNILMEWAFWWDYNEPKRNMKLEDLKRLGLGPIEAFFYGDYEYNKTRGGLPALREEIEKTHSNGGKISLYTFPCACAAGTKLDREHGKEWASMSAPGKYRHGYTQEGKGWNMCMYSQAFGAYMGERLGNVVRETGCDGCRLDVLASMLPCFNPDHSHHDGTVKGAVSPGDLGQVLTMIQKAVRSANPNAFLSTEHAGNDYLTQFTDGFFSENISWISESPRWAPFRALNMYSLVFTRFYFPEVKTWIHGPSDRITAIKMGLFNATGVACTHPDGVKAANTLRENSDALNSETPPEPYVDTLLEYVYANRFSCPRKKVWTIYNRSGKKTDQPILEVPSKENTHYMELLRDQPARAEKIHREVRLAVPMDDDDVAFLAELPVVISAEIKDDKISISLPEDYRKREGLTLRICYENDQADTVSYPVKSGVTPLSLPQYKKLIVKLFDGYYLVDEIALTKQP
jgi:hypothetical protein